MTRKFLSNSYGMTIFKKLIFILTGLLSTIFLTRYLGPSLKGEYSYYLNIINVATTFLNLGISLIYPNYKRDDSRSYKSIFVVLSLAQFGLYMIFATAYSLTKGFQGDITLVSYLVPLSILSMQLTQINLVEQIKSHSIISIVSSLFNLAGTFLVFVFFPQYLMVALWILVLKNILIVILSLNTMRVDNWKVEPRLWKGIIVAGFLPMMTTMLISINYKVDVILLEFLDVSFYNIGLYSTGVALAEYAWLIPDVFKEVMINKNARSDSIRSMCFSIRASMTAVMGFVLGFIVLGKPLIVFMFGSEFIDSYMTTVLMFLAVPFMVYVKIIGTLFMAHGKWSFYFYTLLVSAIVNIGGNFLLVPVYGIAGAAMASIVSYACCGIVFLVWFMKKYHIQVSEVLFIRKKDIQQIVSYLR